MAMILVSGGAGYIGSFTCRALRAAGHQPIIYDNLSKGHHEFVDGDLVVGDVRDGNQLKRLLKKRQVQAVVNFAACALARESVVEPAKYYDNNLRGQMALLEACRACDVEVLVFSSSCSVYGTPQAVPVDENHPQVPISPYGRTKLVCEWMLRDYAAAYGLRYAALRYFNAAGGDPQGHLGEWHDPETHLIPLALEAAVTGRPLKVFGTDHDTPDGSCIRDYIHVEDLARAHVLAVDRLLGGGDPIELNLGTGTGHSVRQVLAAVERAVGRPVPVEIAPADPVDPPQVYADNRRAREVLQFSCKWMDLDEIVASAWAFYQRLADDSFPS